MTDFIFIWPSRTYENLCNNKHGGKAAIIPVLKGQYQAASLMRQNLSAVLNEAIETKDQHTAQMKVDPFMDPLRDDPRFKEVLKKAGFPE